MHSPRLKDLDFLFGETSAKKRWNILEHPDDYWYFLNLCFDFTEKNKSQCVFSTIFHDATLRVARPRRPRTAVLIAEQVLRRIEYLHSKATAWVFVQFCAILESVYQWGHWRNLMKSCHSCNGLQCQGIVHRDIKPENFMFGIKSRVWRLALAISGQWTMRQCDKTCVFWVLSIAAA